MLTKNQWQILLIAVSAFALLVLYGGCNQAARDEEARIEGDFAQSADTDSEGWKELEHDVAVDEGLVTPEELAATGENLPPNLTGDEPADPVGEIGEEAVEGEGEAPEDLSGAGGGFDGAEVYKSASCSMCHGAERAGTDMAPPLVKLSEYWVPETLERYLLDPEGYAATDERLRDQAKQYSMKMPPWSESEEEMAALINWLLEIKPVEEE
jgi:cytochrome c553